MDQLLKKIPPWETVFVISVILIALELSIIINELKRKNAMPAKKITARTNEPTIDMLIEKHNELADVVNQQALVIQDQQRRIEALEAQLRDKPSNRFRFLKQPTQSNSSSEEVSERATSPSSQWGGE